MRHKNASPSSLYIPLHIYQTCVSLNESKRRGKIQGTTERGTWAHRNQRWSNNSGHMSRTQARLRCKLRFSARGSTIWPRTSSPTSRTMHRAAGWSWWSISAAVCWTTSTAATRIGTARLLNVLACASNRPFLSILMGRYPLRSFEVTHSTRSLSSGIRLN